MNNDLFVRFQELLAPAEQLGIQAFNAAAEQPDRWHKREVYTRQANDWKIIQLAT